jgi:hypothetical protein
VALLWFGVDLVDKVWGVPVDCVFLDRLSLSDSGFASIFQLVYHVSFLGRVCLGDYFPDKL